MDNFWNERFGNDDYVYGLAPNEFFKQELEALTPAKLLLPGEGEGRNAVFAAKQGWQVMAFDGSSEGKKKADKLASSNQVSVEYLVQTYDEITLPPESFDCMAFIYTHMPAGTRAGYHQKLASYLKPGGKLILEGFSKAQIHNNTGGPKNVDMLFSKEELQADFTDFTELNIEELETVLEEGSFHQGKATVIRLTATK